MTTEANIPAKKNIFSGIQSSGGFTLGNYLGAIKNWVSLQDDYNCIFSVVDLHSITIRHNPQTLRKLILESFALLLACGIDPKKSILFIQSHVHTHSELAWVLSCYTQFGELSRMTQFKDKAAKHSDNINAGLFSYPVLMAADILLYNTELVPVGADQKQHLELTRDIAERFNGLYGEVFTLPEPYIPKNASRVMSLSDPTQKMSKSDENQNGCIYILDKPDDIMRKFKRAVTDSESSVVYKPGKHGINNLISIYSALTGFIVEKIQDDFSSKGYGDFKIAVAEQVIETLRPIRERYEQLITDKAYLEELAKEGKESALKISLRTLNKVYRKIGLR